jgi:hypothetical protein
MNNDHAGESPRTIVDLHKRKKKRKKRKIITGSVVPRGTPTPGEKRATGGRDQGI